MKSEQHYGALGTFQVRSGYRNGRKPGALMTFRNPANVAEMVNHCNANGHIWLRDGRGNARTVKVNGKVRTWKRDPNRIEVPYKYGLYEYGVLTASDISDVLIEVPTEPKYPSNICPVCEEPMLGSHYHETEP